MVGAKIYITSAKPLPVLVEQRLRTFVDEYPSASIAFVRSGDGEVAVIETPTPEEAQKVAAALASGTLSSEPLVGVLDSTPEGRDLERLYTKLKQRELESQWINRQW